MTTEINNTFFLNSNCNSAILKFFLFQNQLDVTATSSFKEQKEPISFTMIVFVIHDPTSTPCTCGSHPSHQAPSSRLGALTILFNLEQGR